MQSIKDVTKQAWCFCMDKNTKIGKLSLAGQVYNIQDGIQLQKEDTDFQLSLVLAN